MIHRSVCVTGLAVTALILATGCITFDNRPMAPPRYTITQPNGTEMSLEALLDEAATADVVIVGETHDNPVAHHVEYALFKGLLERRAADGAPPRVALSLEMLPRDLQGVTDEYLSGLITEMHFLAASRPWDNYGVAYRRTLNLAKERGAAVIAANAPRRYVNLVSRRGREALQLLSPEARGWIAPLPYAAASPTYRAKLKTLETGFDTPPSKTNLPHSPHGSPHDGAAFGGIPSDAQALWDATMAWSIAESRKQHPQRLVMHITGAFHCEGGLGIPEHLALYDPAATVLVITIKAPASAAPLSAFRSALPIREYLVQTE